MRTILSSEQIAELKETSMRMERERAEIFATAKIERLIESSFRKAGERLRSI